MVEMAQEGQIWGLAVPLIILAAMAICAALIVVLRPVLVRYALARPNARSSHRVPTPQGGGIAVIAATIGVTLIVIQSLSALGADALGRIVPVFAATVLIAMVGAIDDIRTLPAGTRLMLHTIAVISVIAALPAESRVFELFPFWLERVLLVVGGVWFVNLVNFMDGVDWMTVAEIVPLTGGLALAGVFGALPPDGVLVALALLGAMLGFAPFNKPVARLFLGDVGSLPIGLLTGWMLVLLASNGYFIAALILPLYYLADSGATLVRRIARRERIWQAHRTHYYQRATDNGFTVPEIVGRVFAINVALVALAMMAIIVPSAEFPALAIAVLLVGGLIVNFARRRR
jgi:UDP-N-acetylmuramyl pentapeptide phosphotransferase/UDP-N-acetylglucosamine-1-phosphate transferase